MDQIASMCKTQQLPLRLLLIQGSCCPQMPRRATTRRAARPAAARPGRMAIARHWPRRWRRPGPGKSSSQSRTPRPTSGACTPSSRSSERRCCFSRSERACRLANQKSIGRPVAGGSARQSLPFKPSTVGFFALARSSFAALTTEALLCRRLRRPPPSRR